MRDIELAIQEHKQKVLEYYSEYQILGIFVYGSQNYGLATQNSDIDTKAVIIPTIEDLALHPVKTKTLIFDNGEHCEIMDIMHLVANYKKQNINETISGPVISGDAGKNTFRGKDSISRAEAIVMAERAGLKLQRH